MFILVRLVGIPPWPLVVVGLGQEFGRDGAVELERCRAPAILPTFELVGEAHAFLPVDGARHVAAAIGGWDMGTGHEVVFEDDLGEEVNGLDGFRSRFGQDSPDGCNDGVDVVA